MAVGGEIKTVLSLDVSKFTSNLDRATSDLSKFDKGLKDAAKVATTFEKSVKEMAGDSTAVSDKFKLLDQTITSFVNKLAATAEKLSGVTRATGNVKKAASDLDDGLKPVKNSLSAISKETDVFRIAMDSLKPSLQRAAQGNKDLAKSQKEGASVAKQAAADTIQAKISELNNEVKSNNEMIASRRRAAAELARLEGQMRNEALGRRVDADNRYFGRNAGKGTHLLAEADRIESNANQIREQTAATMADVAVKERRNEEIAQEIALLRQEAAAEAEASAARRLATQEAISQARQEREAAAEAARERKEADRQAIISAREAAVARKQAAREAAQYERDQAYQIASMWKGMAQLWAASKIEHGLKASIGAADDMQRQKVMVQSLGYDDAHNQAIYKDAFNMSSQLKFISNLDAIKSRMSAIASIGYDNAAVIDKTLSSAVKASNNLQQLGVAHGDMQNTIRNLYGVVEMRQQTANADATNNTFEVLQKIILGTQGKVQTQDVETMMRRLGMGASQVSDDGLMKLAAIIDQFKVAGGEHGGGSAGVSTVGTMIKMFQSYALGKGLSNEAVKEFSGAGVLNASGLNLGKDSAHILTDAKHAGLKDAALWLSDPVAAIQKIMPQIIAYTQKSENRAKYYEGRDVNNAESQATAVAKYLAALGITTTAAQGAWVAGDPRSAERIAHQVGTMKGEKSIDGVDQDLQKTYARNVQEMNAALTDLKTNVGATLLPVLTEVLKAINSIVKSAAEFARNNPIATQFTAMAVGAGGLLLGIKGVVSMFGMFGGVSTTLRAVTSAFLGTSKAAIETAEATELAGAKSATTKASMFSLSGVVAGAKGDWEVYAKTLRTNMIAAEMASSQGILSIRGGLGMLGSTVMNTAKLVGKGFLRMIPLVGELLMAWDFANLIAGLEVGGHQIKDWMAHLMDWLVTKAKNGWEHIKDVFSLGMNHAAHAAAIAANNKEYAAGSKANGFGDQPQAGANAAAGAKAAQDAAKAAAKAAKAAAAAAGSDAANDAANAKVHNAANVGKQPRQFENLFLQSLAQLQGNLTIARLKLGTALTGDESYREQAEAAFKEHWLGGQFDDGHDPTKRKFMKGGATNRDDINSLDMNNPQVKKWIAEKQALLELEEQQKAVTFAKERAKATDESAKAAVDSLTEGTIKQSAAMKALVAEFARANARTPGGPSQEVLADQAKALANQQIIDSVAYAAELKQKNQGFKFSTNVDGSEMDTRTRILKEHADLIKKVTDEYAAQAANAGTNENKIAEAYGNDSNQYKEAVEARKKIDEQYAKYKANLDHQLAEQLRTPLDKMLDGWKNVNDQIAEYEVRWANGILGTIEKATTGGFKSFKDFKDHVRQLLTDMLTNVEDMLLKNVLGTGIKSIAGGLGDSVKGMFASMNIGNAGKGQGAGGDVFGKMVEGVKGFWTSLTGATNATKDATAATTNGIMAMGKDVAQTLTKTTAETSATTALASLAAAAQSATTALASISAGGGSGGAGGLLGGMFGGGTSWDTGTAFSTSADTFSSMNFADISAFSTAFADGGIMTDLGPLALKAYSNGGIANGPQLALFGEGRMHEAYVPLPDGRTIPVTIKSDGSKDQSGGNSVVISITVNGSNGADTSSSTNSGNADPAMWNRLADRVKGVVREELVTQQRPGGILYK